MGSLTSFHQKQLFKTGISHHSILKMTTKSQDTTRSYFYGYNFSSTTKSLTKIQIDLPKINPKCTHMVRMYEPASQLTQNTPILRSVS